MTNYPVGCHNAPWDAPEKIESEIEVSATCTLTAFATVTTYDAVAEYDEDGLSLDKSEVDAQTDFEREHYTPSQLLNALKEMCYEKLKTELNPQVAETLQNLAEDCILWTEQSFEVTIDE